MQAPSPDTIDRIAAETADDLRRLCGVWSARGAAALDQAVLDDAELSFAVLDARGNADVVKLVALRRARGAVLLTFAQTTTGVRHVLVHGLGEFHGVVLVADPSLQTVALGAGTPAWSPRQTPAEMLAEHLAPHVDAGVTPSLALPADALALPADFAPDAGEASSFAPALLAALDAAAAAIGGRMSFSDALRAIALRRSDCGPPERDPDLAGIYAVDVQRDDLDRSFAFKRSENADWTWEQELASYEAFARKHGEEHCHSLLARLRGDAFAKIEYR